MVSTAMVTGKVTTETTVIETEIIRAAAMVSGKVSTETHLFEQVIGGQEIGQKIGQVKLQKSYKKAARTTLHPSRLAVEKAHETHTKRSQEKLKKRTRH